MGTLNYQNYCAFVAEDFKKINWSKASERRIGASEYAPDIMHLIEKDLITINTLIMEKRLNWEKASNSVTDSVLEITSLLYAAGTEDIVWRHWSSLTGFGMFLKGEIQEAAQYAALGGEWDFLKILSAIPVKSKGISEQVFWRLVTGKFIVNLPESTNDGVDNAWLQLAKSIPAQDYKQTEEAFKKIADFWMAEDEDDWMSFHPRSYPDFETPACAIAAIARHHGFTPTSLTPGQYSFLEAGLAIAEPSPMFPNIFSLPASSTAPTD